MKQFYLSPIICQCWPLLCFTAFLMEPRIYTSNGHYLTWWSTILLLDVLTFYCVVLYRTCSMSKGGQDWLGATTVLALFAKLND